MNTITFECDEDVYLSIPKEIREFITIKTREDKEYDYSEDEEWLLMKKESDKAFKKRKNYEYEILKREGKLD